MRKYHFSRAETRSMALDHPIGDPIGGAVYGEKNDPVSAVVSLATMGGTYAAAGSFAAMSVMQGITFAGAALNLVGNVTGNKTLQKVGMVAGIAGGIGQLAGIQGPTLGQTFGKLGASPTTAPVAPPSAGPAPLSQTSAGATPPGQYVGVNAGPTTVSPAAAPVPAAQAAAPAPAGVGAGTSSYTGGMIPAGSTPADITAMYKDVGAAAGAGGGGVWESVKGAGKSLMEFTRDNPGGAVMIGSTASTLADYLSGKTDAEIDALEAQKNLYGAKAEEVQAAIQLERDRRRRLNEGWTSVDTGIKVNPNISMQSGLIAQNMQQG
jgi:hypothetical protein